MKNKYIYPISQINKSHISLVGGKGSNLGELMQAGLPVPDGFCVSTIGFDEFMKEMPNRKLLSNLSIAGENTEQVKLAGKAIRAKLGELKVPERFITEFAKTMREFGLDQAYSVRSSATAEDLPDASFAGQQDTYLNVIGLDNIIKAVKNCWISLFTDRAILYRNKNNYDHHKVKLSVIIQKMVQSEKSGIMFTADPVSEHRYTISIDAGFGLGEALVSGIITPDLYQVDSRSRSIIKKEISTKKLLIRSNNNGETTQTKVHKEQSKSQALTDNQIIELASLGTKIENHYKFPQDIEWALIDNNFYILQSRPITSLYPMDEIKTGPETMDIYMSFGHQQMMTDVLAPLSVSIFSTLLPIGKESQEKESRLVSSVGGRMYANLSPGLRHPLLKKIIFGVTSQFDALAPKTMLLAMQRAEFSSGEKGRIGIKVIATITGLACKVIYSLAFKNLDNLIEQSNKKIDNYLQTIRTQYSDARTNEETLQIFLNILNLKKQHSAIRLALSWIPSFIAAEIAKKIILRISPHSVDKNSLNDITLGLRGNVVTEMNKEVGDLADLARESKAAMELFQNLENKKNPPAYQLKALPGGEFKTAWHTFIKKYGSRGPSEIDISTPKWYEEPTPLLKMIQGYLQKQKGSHLVQHQRVVNSRKRAKQDLLDRSAKGLFGPLRKLIIRRCIYVLENAGGMREHHKFLIIQILRISKEALKKIGKSLTQSQLLNQESNIWYLTLSELKNAIQNNQNLKPLIKKRKQGYTQYKKLRPPLILTSHGEIPRAEYQIENLPDGAWAGNPVSSGVVEGIAKVIKNPQTETLNKGEILIASFTDPGWTPLFINAGGVVLEIGGIMTHGSVVAREYGIPAVVGIKDATCTIKSGQMIRVDGNQGIVELL